MSNIEQKQAKKNHLSKKKKNKRHPKTLKMKIETHMVHEAVILRHLQGLGDPLKNKVRNSGL